MASSLSAAVSMASVLAWSAFARGLGLPHGRLGIARLFFGFAGFLLGFADFFVQRVHHTVQGHGELADFILSVQAQPLVQLPGGHGAGKAQGPAHRNRDAAGERKADQQAHDQSRGADRVNQRNGIADFIIGGADGRDLQSVAGSGDALGGADAFVAGLAAVAC